MVCVHHGYARNLFVEAGKGPTERGSHHISLPSGKCCFCVLSLLFLVFVGRGSRYCGIVVSAHLFNPPIGTGEIWSRGEDEIRGEGGGGRSCMA